jgi:xylan 1,4-beta-xylosidase
MKKSIGNRSIRLVQMAAPLPIFFVLLLLCAAAFPQSAANPEFRLLQVDAGKVIGTIRSFQGLNGPPSPVMAGLPNLVEQYKELRVDQVRTHDFMGPTEIDSKFEKANALLAWLIPDSAQRAGVVKAGNAGIIFPNWSADPEKAESYNFAPTDKVLAAIHASGAEIYYRIGRSWGANINPPADFDKYANVLKHIAMHYNQGWANGFRYEIRYWEFWNEPDGLFWTGTPDQFYTLYGKTALALKSVDPTLKVGGVGKAFPYDDGGYREGFIDYCAAHKLPLDFYSWHTYTDSSADPYDAIRLAKRIREILDSHGFPKAESILSEWNLTPDFTDAEKARLQGIENAAYIGAVLSYFQDAPIDHAHFYRGDAAWMGLFDPQGHYFKTAYTFQAMAKMLDTPERLAVEGADTFGYAALAGRSQDGSTIQILISNYAIPAGFKPHTMQIPPEVLKAAPQTDFSKVKFLPPRTDILYRNNAGYDLTINNLPWGPSTFSVKRYRIGKTHNLELVKDSVEEKFGAGGRLHLSSPLAPDAVELIVLRRQ